MRGIGPLSTSMFILQIEYLIDFNLIDFNLNYIPVSVGWSEWENWTTCPVTCGAGQQVSIRHCRDKEKYQEGFQVYSTSLSFTQNAVYYVLCIFSRGIFLK